MMAIHQLHLSTPRMLSVRSGFLIAAFVTAGSALAIPASTPLRADAGAQFCATFINAGGPFTRCDYYTFAQCQAALSGIGGSCDVNHTYVPGPYQGQPRRRSR